MATKLFVPVPPPYEVARPRLIDVLNESFHRKLTLISAPAGFGKTTLISEWIAGRIRQCEPAACAAWLSLDEGDSDLTRFLTYFVAALRKVAPNIGEKVLDPLQSPQPLLIEPIMTVLLNELSAIPGDIFLVLDDYHRIDSQAVDTVLTFLLDHLPPNLHLIITTREDPQLPLARMRARGELTELRANHLRFTPAEAAVFLRAMRLNLSGEDVEALGNRTEGWIAGLQLAALALQGLVSHESHSLEGYQEVSVFIQTFAGNHRYIMDYLVEEVIQRQEVDVRSFLLQTAILDRLHGSLCDAVTGQEDSSARLQLLQRGNLFIVALDDQRQWYRYHHLFSEVLLTYLVAEQPDQVPLLHRRASAWFEQHGYIDDAVRHAMAAKDFPHAAYLVEQAFPAMSRMRQEATLLGWLRALPEMVVRERPVLCNLYAGVLLQHGMLENVDAWLRAAEQRLDSGAGRTVVNDAEFRRLPGAIAIHRAGLALMLGNVADTIHYARQALELVPEEDYLGRGGAAGLLGLSLWRDGELEAAQRIFSEGILMLQKAGHFSDAAGLTLAQADILIAQGRLREAMHAYERVLQLAAEQGTPAIRGTADMLVGMSELYLERNDLAAAEQHLQRSKDLGEHAGLPQNRYRWRAALAQIREAEGDFTRALELLDEADRLYAGDFSPYVRPVPAMKARAWAAQGKYAEAFEWSRARELSAEDDLSYLREYEHITLVRILLARYRIERSAALFVEALGLLERLLNEAEAGGRMRSVIELRMLLGIMHFAQGDTIAALPLLHQALQLAEPEGFVRMFVDEGSPMEQLLHEAAAHGIMPDYTGRLLAAFEASHQRRADATAASIIPAAREADPVKNLPVEPHDTTGEHQLVEALSERELEVLRLFRTELSGPEIAQELVIALSTVRTHTKSIYSKLNVNSRRAAVKRAVELHLI